MAKKTATEFDHMATFVELVTVEQFREIVENAIESAKAGDAAARDWIGVYAMGKPLDTPCHLSCISLTERQQQESAELLGSIFPEKKGRSKK